MKNYEYWMKIALEEAKIAFEEDEIPVGAVLVKNNELILRNHNKTRQLQNPLAHAEKLIIEEILSTNKIFLYEYSLFVTLEPCLMCSGMMIWSRLGELIFGAFDKKAGCVGSVYNVLRDRNFNHHPKIKHNVLAEESSDLLRRFFQKKR
jgi:tRNA(adenine34) deaminase